MAAGQNQVQRMAPVLSSSFAATRTMPRRVGLLSTWLKRPPTFWIWP